MTKQLPFSDDQDAGYIPEETPSPGKPILQSTPKSRTKRRMITLPTLTIAFVSVASIPLVWAASSLAPNDASPQQLDENSSSTMQVSAREDQASDHRETEGESEADTFRLPIPTVESALAFFQDRELIAHFMQRIQASSSTTISSEPTHAAVPQDDSSSSRKRIRLKEFKFAAPPVPPEDPREAQKAYGVYLTAGSAKNIDLVERTMQNLVDRGATAFVLDIKGSFVYFPTDVSVANEFDMVRPLFDLTDIVRRAHEKGLYVIGRYIAVKDSVFAEVNNGEFAMRHPKTNANLQTQWVEPHHPTVLEYNRQIITEAALTGIDEINLDYIRYPTSLPQTLAAISTEEKSRRIGTFVQMAREAVDAAGMGTKLGISSYAILGWNYEANLPNLGQDVVQFAPLLDVISPMAYPSTFSPTGYGSDPGGRSRDYWLVYRTLTGYKELLGPEHDWKLRPWIQAYYKNAKNIRDQIDAIIDTGGCGFTMWSASNDYVQTYSAFNNWKQPEHCLPTI